MNRYPLWKNLLIIGVLVMGLLYALPNLFGDDEAIQIAAANHGTKVTEQTKEQVVKVLSDASITPLSAELLAEEGGLLVRFDSSETQLRASDLVRQALGTDYTVALNLAPRTPAWLVALNAEPMNLGLDLRGGVHFLLAVDMEAAIGQALERTADDIRNQLREAKVRYMTVVRNSERVEVRLRSAEDLAQAETLLHDADRALTLTTEQQGEEFRLYAVLGEKQLREIRNFALQQNITTLRNRVNELGVAEPTIQQQGDERIVVQLPGVQDTAQAKRILGATATLEYHAVDEDNSVAQAKAGRIPIGSRLYKVRKGGEVLLKKQVIVSGSQVIDAASGIDQQSGSPMVSVSLDSVGARKMGQFTRDNVGHGMAVVFIENRTESRMVDGKEVLETKRVEEVISVATIRDHFSGRFQTTGLDSTEEARDLALLLRAGALAAPMQIVEERTIGPSLGADNIERGFTASLMGFGLVVLFMGIYYRAFGLVADVALLFNVVLLIALLSILHATLTLPGIAGIALTLGMAVDANVLIFERIREELRNGNSPQASISAGFDRAAATIADSNITTLLAAAVLFIFGTGPVKGFAVTLSIGILTSMFTAIIVSRMFINYLWGGRRLSSLPV